ncbi:MAG TPA: hypothetical protein VER03_26000 [Bryobacteraceae bacterium]|nr:hypothetical protein [Bryobacteraceae bacterium]
MADELSFFGWERSAVYDLATGALQDGRLGAALPLTLADRESPGNKATQSAEFLLAGPKDISGVRTTAIARRYPPPGNTKAETTKLVYVEFSAPDLPWRYTPQTTTSDTLRPWVVLIVGTEAEITLATGGAITCSDAVAAAHPLAQSARWAHIQEQNGKTIARILSPRPLQPDTAYIAALVPAFNDAGANRWTATGFTAPAYDLWRFHTAEAGDFESLAGALLPGKASPSTGRAPVQYPRIAAAPPLSIRGAIAPLFGADAALPGNVAADVAVLRSPLTDPRNRRIIGLPVYGSEWTANPAALPWGSSLNNDPRHRGVAGLGMRAAVDLQDQLMEAATTQSGALGEAAQRVRQLTFGLMAARSLWTRRLPSDPMQRLELYGSSMRRMLTGSGPVLGQVAGEDRPLPEALFSTAARRALRRGPARTELAVPNATSAAAVLNAANTCPLGPDRAPAGLPHVDGMTGALGLPQFEQVLRTAGEKPRIDRANSKPGEIDEGSLKLAEEIGRGYEMPVCKPVNLIALEQTLTAAIDPTVQLPIAATRVLETITGLGPNPLKPIEVCIGLDFPLWTWMRDHAADWLLPGINELKENAVAAFESNPVFVDAFLAGFNTQVISELRWRNIPLATGCTPVRMFWGPVDASGKRLADINGIATWPASSPLGDTSHGVGAAAGSDVILVFRTDLFRRYPKTLIYLVPPVMNGANPDWNVDPNVASRVLPSFQGQVAEDIVFFRFDVSPANARKHWVVLEEPPIGITFRNDKAVGGGVTDGASFAIATIDQTTRVLIPGAALIPEP